LIISPVTTRSTSKMPVMQPSRLQSPAAIFKAHWVDIAAADLEFNIRMNKKLQTILGESRKREQQLVEEKNTFKRALHVLQAEKEASKKLIAELQQELIAQHLAHTKTLEDNNREVIAWRDNIVKIVTEERKRFMLERKAADDEIIRLRSLIDEVKNFAEEVPEGPPKKKQKIRSLLEDTKLCGNTEFDAAFFEEASATWNANKVRKEYGYVYKCINPRCDQEGECDFDMCCYECYDKVCRNGSCKIRVTSKKKRGFCNECFETCGY
jgi:hypothetical protein